MLAPTTRISSTVPYVVEVVIGEVLERVILSVEALRDQLRRLSLR